MVWSSFFMMDILSQGKVRKASAHLKVLDAVVFFDDFLAKILAKVLS